MSRSFWSVSASRKSHLLFSAAIILLLIFSTKSLSAQIAAQYDFENGTTQGWGSFFNGGNAPTNAIGTAHGGTHSLLTSTSSTGTGGPSIDITSLVIPGATYQITGFIRLTTGETAANTNFTVKRTDPGCSGGTCFDTVGAFQVATTDSGWAQIGGTYTVSTTATDLLLFGQLVGATTQQSFYIDDVVINEIAGPPGGPQDNSGISTNFEDGGLDGWSSRAGATVANSTADAHGGTHSLLVTGRTHSYDGPQISVSNKMYNGSSYAISVWVKLDPTATAADTIRVSLQTTLAGTVSFHTVINNTPIPLNTWVNLSIPTYSMAVAYDPGTAFLYVESSSGTQSFYIDDFTLTFNAPVQIQTDIPSVFQTLSYYFPVGAEVDSSDLAGPHAQLLAKHFNSIVSGNDMKWSSVEPTEGTFTFTNADAQVKFAQAHNMLVRGHNLVWANGSQTPAWVFLESDGTTPLSASNPADVALLTQRIQNHIMDEVQHFGSAIYVWDVVNEPLDSSQTDCLNHGPFYKILGKSYIDIALQAARQFAPAGTQLFINDFNTSIPARLQCLENVVQDLQTRGTPIDGVGHEMHNRIDFPQVSDVVNAINDIASKFPGLHQQVTEMDISVYKGSDNTSNYGANGGSVPPSIIAEQGWLYYQFFKAFRELKGKLDAVTFWGLADDNTWLDGFPINRLDLPLLFDTRLQAKPAYWGIVDPTQLPGYGLTFSVASKSGTQAARVWTITATNSGSGTAYATQINGFTLTQTAGAACTPVIVPPSTYPVVLGDITPGNAASAAFTINFTGCANLARFSLKVPWSSAVYDTGTLTLGNQFR